MSFQLDRATAMGKVALKVSNIKRSFTFYRFPTSEDSSLNRVKVEAQR